MSINHTPIEIYRVKGRMVFVKRDDLYGIAPAPPLAKLRGLRILIDRLHSEGVSLVGCWDTRISKLGLGLAAYTQTLPGMACVVSYPTKQGIPEPVHVGQARKLGAEIYPVPGGRITISFAAARKYVESKGGVMLPFGLECKEAIEGVRAEAASFPRDLLQNSVLFLSCGSGVTLAGILAGLPQLPKRIVGVSSGRSVANIRACIKRNLGTIPKCVHIHEAEIPYSYPLSFPCPFSSNPYYDLKAWKYLVGHIRLYTGRVIFWNIGA